MFVVKRTKKKGKILAKTGCISLGTVSNIAKNRQLRSARASWGRKTRSYRTQEICLTRQNPSVNFVQAVQVGAP